MFAKRKRPKNLRSNDANESNDNAPSDTEIDIQQTRQLLQQLRKKPAGIPQQGDAAVDDTSGQPSAISQTLAAGGGLVPTAKADTTKEGAGLLNQEQHMNAFIESRLKGKDSNQQLLDEILLPIVREQPHLAISHKSATDSGAIKSAEASVSGGRVTAHEAILKQLPPELTRDPILDAKKSKKIKDAVEEGDVEKSGQLLRGVPEVDLGKGAKLRNIEETEQARKRLREQREQPPTSTDGSRTTDTGAQKGVPNRWFYGRHQQDGAETAKPGMTQKRPRFEKATDDAVATRFINKMRK